MTSPLIAPLRRLPSTEDGLRDYGTGRWEGGDEEGCDHLMPLTPQLDRAGGQATGTRGEQPSAHRGASQYRDTCGKCGARRIDQQIGLESTPEEWRDRLVEVFRELRRVLVPTGTLWVECGDSYAHGGAAGGSVFDNGRTDGRTSYESDKARGRQARVSLLSDGLKPKDLIGAPFLLAFGLRDDGWWWRSTNIWAKPNCLPESVTDRPVVSHSYVFQFSKKARYFHDAEAVREGFSENTHSKGRGIGIKQAVHEEGGGLEAGRNNRSFNDGIQRPASDFYSGRSLRSVWQIPTQGFPEAHFATWPTKLAERILLMACPESVCRVCGVPRTRLVDYDGENPYPGSSHDHTRDAESGASHGQKHKSGKAAGTVMAERWHARQTQQRISTLTDCGHSDYRPGICLDPFVGSGTTCHVARNLNRRSVGIDLNSEYLDLAARRLQQQSLFAEEVA